jgi:PTS system glucitol/sorbitol-specific IIA component
VKLQLGEATYTIKKVGSAANQNFNELGHISIYFRDGENEILPGAILVEPGAYPKLTVGDIIRIGN